jgi:hypothetical protein
VQGKGAHCKHCGFAKGWRGFMRLYEPPSKQEQTFEDFVAEAQNLLALDPTMMQYLLDRGFTHATITGARLGLCPRHLPTPEDIEFGLAYPGGKWVLHDRLIIPYIQDGIVVTVRGRQLPGEETEKKYLSLPNSTTPPYVVGTIDMDKPVLLCEGEFDALLAHQHGFQAIGIPGAQHFEKDKEHISHLPNLYIAFDGDDAGRKGMDKVIKSLTEARRVDLPEGFDVGEYLNQFGPASFQNLIDKAELYLHGKHQKEDRFAIVVENYADWAWSNGKLLGPTISWAPRMEKALSGWSPGLILIGAEAHCFALGTEVLMYDGTTKKVEDVQIGDQVMGPDSTPRNVTSLSRGTAPLHKVKTRTMDYTVTGNHILALRRYSHKQIDFEMTVDEFYKQTDWFKSKSMMYRTPGVDFQEQPTEISPYYLGLWLGDGQHIPREFLVNSREARLSLLAGLIDSDGHLSGETYEIVQKNQTLANDIVWLARSLGFYASVTPCQKTCTNNGKTGTYYRVYLLGDFSDVPTLLTRKSFIRKTIPRYGLNEEVTVTPAGIGEFAGFTVDGDHLFLGADFTVLHNSGKSCFLVKSLYEVAIENPTDTVAVYLSLDDTIEEAMTRMLSLHSDVEFGLVRQPRNAPVEAQKKVEAAVKTLKRLDNLILRDATYGRSLNYLSTLFEKLRQKYPEKRIVVFIDSLAKIVPDLHTETESGPKANWKAYLASELKYLSTKHGLCIVTPTDLRKINGFRRPVRDDLKDAAELAYEANVILLGYNDLKKNREDAAITWVGPEGDPEPILEFNIDKNKITGITGNIRYRMLGATSNFQEVSFTEDQQYDIVMRNQIAQSRKVGP